MNNQTQYNRWHVYEHIKQTCMFSGRPPTERDCIAKFGGYVPRDEIEEGIIEFEITAQLHVPRTKIYSRKGVLT